MNDLDEYQDVVTTIRSGLGEIRHSNAGRHGNLLNDAVGAPDVGIPLRPQRHARFSGVRGPLVAAAASLIVLVLAMVPVALLRSGTGTEPDAEATALTLTEDSAPSATSPAVSPTPVWGWTNAPVPEGFGVHAIVALDGRFFGLATDDLEIASDDPEQDNIENPDPVTRLWVSEDGTTWEAIDVDSASFGMRAGYFRDLDMIGDTFIATVKGVPLTEGNVDQRLVFSTDARTWAPADLGNNALVVAGLAGSPDGGVALTRSEEATYDTYDVWYSTDGATWTQTGTEKFSGISEPTVTAVKGRFYIGASELVADSEPPALWVSDDAAEWTRLELPSLGASWAGRAIPTATNDGRLLLATGGRSASQLWIAAEDGSWAEVTPPGYAGEPQVTSSEDGAVLIVAAGQSGGPQEPEYYRPAALWWSLDGREWTQVSLTDTLGTEGTIQAAAANGNTIVIIHYSHPDWIGSLQIGTISE